MRKRTSNRVYVRPQWYIDKAVAAVYQHGRHIDVRALTYLVRCCVRAFDEATNPLGMVTLHYTTIARHVGIDVRTVKTCLGFFEGAGMLSNVTDGRRHMFILHGLTTHKDDDATSMSIQESKESKERSISPCTPSLSKENKEKKDPPHIPQRGTLSPGASSDFEKKCRGGKQGGSRCARAKPEGSIDERRNRLIGEMQPWVAKYGRDMCNAFFSYWTETERSGELMRFELKRTWQTERRLEAWARHGERIDARKDAAQHSDPKAAEERERTRVENERRRLEERLESVPPWAIVELKKHSLYKENMDARGIYGTLEQLKVRKRLESDTLDLLEAWKKERNKVQIMFDNLR